MHQFLWFQAKYWLAVGCAVYLWAIIKTLSH